jgi:hypothetical protein
MIPPAVVGTTIRAAIAGIDGAFAAAGGRGGTALFARAVKSVPAGVAMSRDKVIAVGIPLAAFGGRYGGAVGLPKESGVRLPYEAAQQKQA